jgi:hypothetical protein
MAVLYRQLCEMPDGTMVRLMDGGIGRITAWYHVHEAIGVRAGGRYVVVRASHLELEPQGQAGPVVSERRAPGRRPLRNRGGTA